MTDVTRPPEKIEKPYPELVEKGALQKKVARAAPPSDRATPAVERDDQAIKRNLQPGDHAPNAEAERKIKEAARQGIEEERGDASKEMGRAGERASIARLQNAGEAVDDLNRYQGNFPLVDVSTDQRIQSVKVKSVDKPPDAKVYDRYRYDLEDLQNVEKSGKAADALQKHGARLPSELGPNPSRERIATYIREKGELAIPDDHVAGTRQSITDMARQAPGCYGLDAYSPTLEQDIQKLTERVQPIGVTSSEIFRMRHQA